MQDIRYLRKMRSSSKLSKRGRRCERDHQSRATRILRRAALSFLPPWPPWGTSVSRRPCLSALDHSWRQPMMYRLQALNPISLPVLLGLVVRRPHESLGALTPEANHAACKYTSSLSRQGEVYGPRLRCMQSGVANNAGSKAYEVNCGCLVDAPHVLRMPPEQLVTAVRN
jgi:hypothetical protein